MVQLPWIAYAILTGLIGFIPGCAISATVQDYNFLGMEDGSQERSPVDVAAFGASRSVPTL